MVNYVAFPSEIFAPSEQVTFYVNIENNSDSSDPVTITSLVSDVYGPLAGLGDCFVGFTIAPGAEKSCMFTKTVGGDPGDTLMDTVIASGTDDEGTPVSDDNPTFVHIKAAPTPSPTPKPTRKVRHCLACVFVQRNMCCSSTTLSLL